MEQNGRGLLRLTNKVWLVVLHNQSCFWHQRGDTRKDKQKGSLDSHPPSFTGGETEARTGGMTGPRCLSSQS